MPSLRCELCDKKEEKGVKSSCESEIERICKKDTVRKEKDRESVCHQNVPGRS